ncbi:MAG: hypothetical protein U1F66_05030 [bacterium]
MKACFSNIRSSFWWWLLGLSLLTACTGSGTPGGALGSSGAELSGASLPGPSVPGNAADKYEGGFPAPAADTENCPYNYCLLDAKFVPECRNEDGSLRLSFSARVLPGMEDKWKSLDGRTLRLLELERGRFVDVALQGEVGANEYNNLKNRSGSFQVSLNGKIPLKRELYVLPLGQAAQQPLGKELPCAEGLCSPSPSDLVTWEGSDLAPKHFPEPAPPALNYGSFHRVEKPAIQAVPSRLGLGRELPLCNSEAD